MTDLRIEPYDIPAATLGPENPLPQFRAEEDDLKIEIDPSVPEEDRRYLGWRIGSRVLPHRMQDNYDRIKRPRSFRAAVLENEFLRVTVLPELGGRVASILHKPSNRELLQRNPVFQPANLALRNAWFCGGIEWNTSQFGHYYLTCSPVFAARIEAPDGSPALRIYEWDRVKCFPWQVDLILPHDSHTLFARVRIVNPHEHELPMYWWTNIGVPEAPRTRTIVPADSSIHGVSQLGFALANVPMEDGCDITYPANAPHARGVFFRIPDDHRKWIASVDREGRGIFHASTACLLGRKMFVFGMNNGGRRWQEYLMVPGEAYYEIQAGLARTQEQCVPMPANTEWTWTEAFGYLDIDPSRAHSSDWDDARHAAESALDAILPQSRLDLLHAEFDQVTRRAPAEVLAVGSGWGALERRRLARRDEPDRIPRELPFDESTLGPEQQPWLSLLETGVLPEHDPLRDPGHYMIQPEWREMLEAAIKAGASDHWLAWLHLGVMRMESHDPDGARAAWETSLVRTPNAWALRNLAVLETRAVGGVSDADNPEDALDLLERAWELGPRIAPLAVEYAQALFRLERYGDLAGFIASVPEEVASNERLRIMAVTAAIRLERLAGIETFFDREFTTIREGEVTLTDIWFEYHARRSSQAEGVPFDEDLRRRVRRDFPPPKHIDFRMSTESL